MKWHPGVDDRVGKYCPQRQRGQIGDRQIHVRDVWIAGHDACLLHFNARQVRANERSSLRIWMLLQLPEPEDLPSAGRYIERLSQRDTPRCLATFLSELCYQEAPAARVKAILTSPFRTSRLYLCFLKYHLGNVCISPLIEPLER